MMYMQQYMKLIAMLCVAFACLSAKAQKYDDIYDELPNLSLDQAYSKLLNFQKKNPYFANTYVQLGMVCEHKMAHTDPLRDIESAQFWSDNAHLFFGNFIVFYKDGDLRSNDVYYENLNIPFAGKKLTEADLKAFVAAHEKKCRSFRDSTLLIYNAIAKSKSHYNHCIATFKSLCDKYASYNDLLLAYDKNIESEMKSLSTDIDSCVIAFDEYKRLIKSYPILNYRQVYDVKDIETFRLDGLTNSDFYDNRFFIWDYQKWVKEYREAIENAIKPLRKQVDEINAMYAEGKKEVEKGRALNVALQQPYDELFVFKLGKYDNNSLVRELFAYLETRRQFYVMACDSITFNNDTTSALLNRKMRHIYNTAVGAKQAKASLNGVEPFITSERVARFADFFKKNYGGSAGVKSFVQEEPKQIDGQLAKVVSRFADFVDELERIDSLRNVIDGNSKSPQANRELADFDELNNISRIAINREDGTVAYCVTDSLGHRGEEIDLNSVSAVTHIHNVSNGAVVIGRDGNDVLAMFVGDNGEVSQPTVLPGNGLKVKAVFRSSAHEFCLFMTDADNKPHLVSISNQAVIKESFL